MVQAARLDLIRIAAVGLLAALASNGARAQPLMPASPLLQERPLTTLLQPQKLDQSRSLLHPEKDAAGSAAKGTAPCTRGGRVPGAAPSVYGGGSGPGDFGRYLPSAPTGTATTSTAPAASVRPGSPPASSGAAPLARTPGVDRPLYGGTDRPLWDTGERRSGSAGQPPESPDTDKGTGAGPAGAAPAPARDRPLWADGSVMASADPAAATGIAPAPCIDPVPPVPR